MNDIIRNKIHPTGLGFSEDDTSKLNVKLHIIIESIVEIINLITVL
jgi:hypothetical protein